MNKIHIIGNLTRDPEMKFTSGGTNNANFSIAYNEQYTKDGEKVEKVYFFNCVAWSGLADIISKWFKKGDRIGITGKLQQSRWEDSDGNKRQSVNIVIQEIDFLQNRDQPSNANDTKDSQFTDDDIPF
jgi:single-strand DNA-binding protein